MSFKHRLTICTLNFFKEGKDLLHPINTCKEILFLELILLSNDKYYIFIFIKNNIYKKPNREYKYEKI